MNVRLALVTVALGAAIVLLAARVSRTTMGASSPETGDDVIGRLLGEGREALSAGMLDRADLYFHGGVPHHHETCSHSGAMPRANALQEERTSVDEEHAAEHAHSDRGHKRIEDDHERFMGARDWWTALNRKLHPQSHVHMHGAKSEQELLPWMWAAVRADPHNTGAVALSAYWLAQRLDKSEQALRVLEKGIRKNPDAYELYLEKGRILSDRPAQMAEAETALRTAFKKWRQTHDSLPENPHTDSGKEYLSMVLNLGRTLAANGKKQEAAVLYRHILPLAPHPEHLRRKIRNWKENGKSTSKRTDDR